MVNFNLLKNRHNYKRKENCAMARPIDNKLLGIKISYYRKRKGYTQAQLAEQVNISQSYMAKIECGFLSNCVSLAVLNNISSELNVSIDELISPN